MNTHTHTRTHTSDVYEARFPAAHNALPGASLDARALSLSLSLSLTHSIAGALGAGGLRR